MCCIGKYANVGLVSWYTSKLMHHAFLHSRSCPRSAAVDRPSHARVRMMWPKVRDVVEEAVADGHVGIVVDGRGYYGEIRPLNPLGSTVYVRPPHEVC